MPKGIPLTRLEMDRRRLEIAEAAAELILTRGFNETSVREIAEAAGIGKSTLYDYFGNKEEILVFLVEEAVEDLTQRARDLIEEGGLAADCLYRVMYMHLDFLLEKKAYFLKLTFEIQKLSLESQAQIQVKRYLYQDLIQRLIEEGIAEGSFRPVNPAMAMKSLIAMLTPVVYTSRPAGTPEEMLADALDIFFQGIHM